MRFKSAIFFLRIIRVCAISLAVSGCAKTVYKDLIPTGGSRADATLEMSYEYRGSESPQVDLAKGMITAKQRCAAWGYKNADPFGGEKRRCMLPSQYGCGRWFVTYTYQCV